MINNVVLVGRLVKDIDLRYTQSGTPVGSFTLAVNRAFKNQDGTRDADFINCVVWRKAAEILANYTRKGSQVAVTGRLQTRSYENQQGERRYITEIVIENFQLLDNKGNQENQQQGNQYNQQPNNQAEPTDSQGDPFAGMGSSSIDISDDDLPF